MSFDEVAWWGDCANTFHEEHKQIVYAVRMGLQPDWTGAHPPTFDLRYRSIIDIGGGPVSLLLKCVNRGPCKVVDPANYPPWVGQRYRECDIDFEVARGEELSLDLDARFDEAWIYNVLQHVGDPELVVSKAKAIAHSIRLFEWIGVDPYPGHPHRLEREHLDEWLGSPGFVTQVDEDGAVGVAYYGVFSS